jgi:hypothetical protein
VIRRIVFALIAVLFVHPLAYSELVKEPSVGLAKNSSGKLLYTEKHTSRYTADGRLQHLRTEYQGDDGKVFGYFDTNYLEHPFVPEYEFRDDRRFRAEKIEVEQGVVNAKVQFNKNEPEKKKSYKMASNMVAGQGLHNYMRSHIDDFVKNPKRVDSVEFLIPANETSYDFRVRAKKIENGQITYRVEADSWMFRIVAPHIEATYQIASKRLLIYDGPSNLVSPEGKQEKVVISYSYEGEKKQQTASAD